MTTSNTSQLEMRRLRAPKENRGAVVDPPWNDISRVVEANIDARLYWDHDFQGQSSRRLIAAARQELLEASLDWMKNYRNAPRLPPADLPFFLAGHQPQMFHPGVWLKNFALGRLAEKHAAQPVNLIIDSDVAAVPSVFVPGGSAESPSRERLPYDQPEPAIPYEERKIQDHPLFSSFAKRAVEHISPLVKQSLLEKYWPMVLRQSRRYDLLGASLAQARHMLEVAWNSPTWEVPQSAVCDRPAFYRFVVHLLAQLPRFLSVYNAAVSEYRHQHRIRNRAHPVPDLAVEGEWLESPFWIWTTENPRRRRLFVRSHGKEITISDRRKLEAKLSLSADSDGGIACEQLADLRRRGIKIRSRALITTLWARLMLGDLFIHGIGGGNYDRVTNTIIERFFGRSAPQFMVLSATLHLPIERSAETLDKPVSIASQLRELTYHPERFLDLQNGRLVGDVSSAKALIAEKSRLIAVPQTRENAKLRCRKIREINEQLQPWLADLRRECKRQYDSSLDEARKEKILNFREYAFCLYPEETIRDFFDELLGEID